MKRKKLLSFALALGMVFSLTACGGADDSKDTDAKTTEDTDTSDAAAETEDDTTEATEVVEINYATPMVGSHVSAEAEAKVIEEFNKQYEGQIKINIEELPSDDAYVDKMKTLAASKALPDVVLGKEGIRELAVENGQAVDLLPLLEADAEWKKYIGDEAIEYNKTDDKLYSVANGKQVIGYFYNKELFAQVGIEPAKTWDEFMDNNQKLLDAGITPLALMTGENCWTTNLFLAAMIGSDGDAGNQFMNTKNPESYENDSVIKGLTMIQTCLEKYTTSDAVGAIYANAANNFCQGIAAMCANGPWFTPDFADPEKSMEGFADKVGVAAYPEGGLIEQYEIGYTLCTEGKSPEVQDAALKFFKFKTGQRAQEIFLELNGTLPLTENVPMSDEFKAANPLIAETVEMSFDNAYDFNNIDNTAVASTIEAFSANYPSLASGKMTPEDLAKKLTEAAAKTK
jgi:raffinose/stachyose/melibiose transport system substrate-binding protein